MLTYLLSTSDPICIIIYNLTLLRRVELICGLIKKELLNNKPVSRKIQIFKRVLYSIGYTCSVSEFIYVEYISGVLPQRNPKT